jgi:hypothetical protein
MYVETGKLCIVELSSKNATNLKSHRLHKELVQLSKIVDAQDAGKNGLKLSVATAKQPKRPEIEHTYIVLLGISAEFCRLHSTA